MTENNVTPQIEALRSAVARDAAENGIDLGNVREAIETAASIGAETALAILRGEGIEIKAEGTVESLLAAAISDAV